MRVLVCGGRTFDGLRKVFDELDRIDPDVVITGRRSACDHEHGGADAIAAQWAEANGINLVLYPALWKASQRAAGPIRNSFMLKDSRPDMVLAFPGGRGTADMKRKARAAGIEVREIE